MADVSASMVMELRQRTGLGMMECKKALAETEGDLPKAHELLRIKSGAKASKTASRVTAEGVIRVHLTPDSKVGAMVEVNCETDFVSRNEDFVTFATRIAQAIVEQDPSDVSALASLPCEGGTVESARQALIQKIGENISIRRFARMRTEGRLAQYLHGGGRIGVMVDLQGGTEAVGKDIAMHIAAGAAPGATRPVCVSRDQVPSDVVANERDIYTAQAADSGKPAEIIAKMVEGRVNKFLAEVTLLGQPFVKNPDETVDKYLKAHGATVTGFTLFVVGEGLEKRKDDFAAEVAAMTKS